MDRNGLGIGIVAVIVIAAAVFLYDPGAVRGLGLPGQQGSTSSVSALLITQIPAIASPNNNILLTFLLTSPTQTSGYLSGNCSSSVFTKNFTTNTIVQAQFLMPNIPVGLQSNILCSGQLLTSTGASEAFNFSVKVK